MEYVQQQAHQKLRDCVRCYWKLENQSNDFHNFTILPDGFFDALICFRKNRLEGVFLTGLFDQKTNVVISPETTIYGVQFRMLAVEKIIQKSISSSFNTIKDLDASYLGLDDFVAHPTSSPFDQLDQCLLACIEKQHPIDPRKDVLLKLINHTKGNETVDYYAKKAKWSKTQINRYFQSTFGLSLKSYCSIRKCAATFSQIRNGQLFPQQGYYDQPHYIKALKKITAFTPKELLKNEDGRFLQFSIIKKK